MTKPEQPPQAAPQESPELRFSRAWSPADVAWYLDTSESYIRSLRTSDPSFPIPKTLPGGRLVRWQPKDVIRWFKGDQIQPAHGPDATDPPPKPGRKRKHVI